jgi:hypothetical protein
LGGGQKEAREERGQKGNYIPYAFCFSVGRAPRGLSQTVWLVKQRADFWGPGSNLQQSLR